MASNFRTKLFSTNDFIAKEDVTLWIYQDDSNPKPIHIKKNKTVVVKDASTKWWYIKYKDTKVAKVKGYASKYYFAKNNSKDYEKQLWYFGELSRDESAELLMNETNSEGSYFVRFEKVCALCKKA